MKEMSISWGQVVGGLTGLAVYDFSKRHSKWAKDASGAFTKTGYYMLWAYAGMKVGEKISKDVDQWIAKVKEKFA